MSTRPKPDAPTGLVSPWPVLLGALASFVACCVLGLLSTHRNHLRHVDQFHYFLGPQCQYYPTAPQVRELARSQLPQDRVAAVIAGNAILAGAGPFESPAGCGRHKLRRSRGDRYKVASLAMAGARPADFGA